MSDFGNSVSKLPKLHGRNIVSISCRRMGSLIRLFTAATHVYTDAVQLEVEQLAIILAMRFSSCRVCKFSYLCCSRVVLKAYSAPLWAQKLKDVPSKTIPVSQT